MLQDVFPGTSYECRCQVALQRPDQRADALTDDDLVPAQVQLEKSFQKRAGIEFQTGENLPTGQLMGGCGCDEDAVDQRPHRLDLCGIDGVQIGAEGGGEPESEIIESRPEALHQLLVDGNPSEIVPGKVEALQSVGEHELQQGIDPFPTVEHQTEVEGVLLARTGQPQSQSRPGLLLIHNANELAQSDAQGLEVFTITRIRVDNVVAENAAESYVAAPSQVRRVYVQT